MNIADISPGSHALGPGRRFVIWVQGCPFNCFGCISPDWIPGKRAILMTTQNLARQIIKNPLIEGITVSGGEPFLQAGLLAEMLRIVRKEIGLSVICFTGYLLENLVWPGAQALLRETDVLIDGPFIKKNHTNNGLRGSSNQRIHFLTNKMIKYKRELEGGNREFEIVVRENHSYIIGIPTVEILNKFGERHE